MTWSSSTLTALKAAKKRCRGDFGDADPVKALDNGVAAEDILADICELLRNKVENVTTIFLSCLRDFIGCARCWSTSDVLANVFVVMHGIHFCFRRCLALRFRVHRRNTIDLL